MNGILSCNAAFLYLTVPWEVLFFKEALQFLYSSVPATKLPDCVKNSGLNFQLNPVRMASCLIFPLVSVAAAV